MDVLEFKLHLIDSHVRARVVDAEGERAVDLEGERAARVFVGAASLLDALRVHCGAGRELRAISIDVDAQVARLSIAVASGEGSPGLRLDGAAFTALATPMAAAANAIVSELHKRRVAVEGEVLDGRFWSEVYQSRHDGWELGRAAPPIARALAARELRGVRTLVVGCGRGHEARLCARAGADVVAIDVAPEAIAAARALAAAESLTVDFRLHDVFVPLVPLDERFELVVEHCCFCAISPARRDEYVAAVANALAPGGVLVGLFWAHGRPGGPPFTVTREELVERFSARFEIGPFELPDDSIATRRGQELLVTMRARPSPDR